MCQRVREGVLDFRIEPGLVEELGGPESVETTTKRVVRELGDRLKQREGHVFADNGSRLQQAFVLRGEPVDAGCQDRLDSGGHLERLERLREPIPAARTIERLRLDQCPDRLLQEERV